MFLPRFLVLVNMKIKILLYVFCCVILSKIILFNDNIELTASIFLYTICCMAVLAVITFVGDIINSEREISYNYDKNPVILFDKEIKIGIFKNKLGEVKRKDEYLGDISGNADIKNNIIKASVSYGAENFARTIIHELAHVQYNDKKHLEVGKKLPVPPHSDHVNKERTKEKIAIWFEEYVFDNEKLKKNHKDAYIILDKFVETSNRQYK